MEPLPKELLDLENQLRAFVPQAPQTSREQLLYHAGWEAARAQHILLTQASPAAAIQKTRQPVTHYYWAAACAILLMLSTALGWQFWQLTQPGVSLPVIATTPMTPSETTLPASAATIANTEHPFEVVEQSLPEPPNSALASYLQLRERVTRGGLSMWPVSAPTRREPSETPQLPPSDWQAELLREAL